MSTSTRPIIKLPLTFFDKSIEAIALLVLIGFWVFTLYHYPMLPDTIPTHFGGGGEPDGFGSRGMILGLPIVSTILYLALTIFSRFPHKMNYSVTITEENAALQYRIMTRMIRVLKVMMLIIFLILDYKTVQVALQWPDVLGRWFLLLLFTLLFGPLFYFLIQTSKNS
ncbi:DUF1648 domain-containing protein [Flavobacterium sp. IMCC34852]|uniref:DUF1648 domain-containing protein n=1 Tax=Flavobacterium rivulicola TaxID=2732161 RepID=A0A7Y3RBV3_9FLAO|nr:DUF1648 domain-containing protein [Flavobacterium sp. IMCC34852]NNT73087.1 DUF1648 domain-containing protein [Flavobacterium sp. IMCC34852]